MIDAGGKGLGVLAIDFIHGLNCYGVVGDGGEFVLLVDGADELGELLQNSHDYNKPE